MTQNYYEVFEDPNYILIQDAYEKEEYIAIEIFTPSVGTEGGSITIAGFITNYTKIGCILEYAHYLEKGDKENSSKDVAFVKTSINYQDIIAVTSPYIVIGEDIEGMKDIRKAKDNLKNIITDKKDEPVIIKQNKKNIRRTVKLKKPSFVRMLLNKIKGVK